MGAYGALLVTQRCYVVCLVVKCSHALPVPFTGEASVASLAAIATPSPRSRRPPGRRGGPSRCVMATRDVLHASAAGGLAETSCYGLAAAVGEAPTVAVPHGRVFARGSQYCSYATV